ncbi:MAG: Crp/Fnr family transcriptional regulator [Sporolactobacillus sp.]
MPIDQTFLEQCFPFLDSMSEADRRLLVEKAALRTRTLNQNDMLFSGLEECSGIVVLKSGQLRAYFATGEGKEMTLYRLLPGDVCLLTADCVLKNMTFHIKLDADKASVITTIPSKQWQHLESTYPAVKGYAMSLLNERFSEVMWVIEQMISKSMGQRIAFFLLEQSVLNHTPDITITHETIAKNLGTAREVVSRILKYLENDGLIRLSRGKVSLMDSEKLRRLSK